MRAHIAALAVLVSAAVLSPLAPEARADGTAQQKPEATKESVLALKQKLEKARDAMRALAKTPAPKGLTAEQLKVFEAEMQKLAADADSADAVIKDMGKGLEDAEQKTKKKLHSLSDMGQTEQLRLQSASDRLTRVMTATSNLLKKFSDTANTITQNLK